MTCFYLSSMIAAMRTFFLIFTCVVIVSLLGACNITGLEQSDPTLTAVPDIAPSEEIIEPSQNYEPVECAFMWANDPLPELSADFNQALQTALPDAEGYAEAYGENCVTEEGEVVRFLAMETDYHVTLKVVDLEDKQALGELVERVMFVLMEFPTEETPGPQPGYIGITFETPDDSVRLWIMRTEIETALKNGMSGIELFNVLIAK